MNRCIVSAYKRSTCRLVVSEKIKQILFRITVYTASARIRLRDYCDFGAFDQRKSKETKRIFTATPKL
jgi:hypothetical protein